MIAILRLIKKKKKKNLHERIEILYNSVNKIQNRKRENKRKNSLVSGRIKKKTKKNLPVFHFINCNWKMTRKWWTGVHVTVIFWYQIHIMEYKAMETVLFQSFLISCIHNSPFVKCCITILERKEKEKLFSIFFIFLEN